jgi:hypothetical protein
MKKEYQIGDPLLPRNHFKRDLHAVGTKISLLHAEHESAVIEHQRFRFINKWNLERDYLLIPGTMTLRVNLVQRMTEYPVYCYCHEENQ